MIERLDVAALRLQTELTGRLVAVQVQSVSSWPRIALKDLKSHETRINLETREIEYVLRMKPKKTVRSLQELKIIEESVWALLGDTWRTSFRVGKSIIYAGTRRREPRRDTGIDLGKGREGFDPSGA